jgi:adenylate cyclase
VLEGSVQKSGDQIRISIQLIDAINGEHVWTERYDRPFTDLFMLEDDITLNIMKGLHIKLFSTRGSTETDSLEAWLLKQKANECGGTQTKEGTLCALEFNEKALEHDPNYISALIGTGRNYWQMGLKGYSDSPEESSKKAIEIAQRALEMAPDHAGANGLMVSIHMTNREFSQALALAQKNVELVPNSSVANADLGWVLLANMRPEETIKQFEKAIRLRPFFPRWYYNILIRAHVLAGKYDEALSIIQKQLDRKPGNFFTGQAYLNRAVVYSNLGQQEKAKAEMAKALEVFPKMTLSFIRREVDCTDETFVAHYFEKLEKLGLPE